MSDRSLILDLLKERSFRRGDFTLASGAKSSYYLDARKTVMCSVAQSSIGRLLREEIVKVDITVNAIGGMAVGAVPLVMAALNGPWGTIEGFWVRKEAKDHGTKNVIEGQLVAGMHAVLVEDVTTTGASVLAAYKAVLAHGCKVVGVVSLIDRLQGAAEAFAAEGVPFRSVYTIRDFGVEPENP